MNSDVGAVRCSGRCATAARAEDEDQPGFDEPGCLQCKQRGVEAGLGEGTGRGGHRGGGCRRGAPRAVAVAVDCGDAALVGRARCQPGDRQRGAGLSAAAFTEECTSAGWRTKPTAYLVSAQDRAISPDTERFMAERMGRRVATIDASHVAFMSRPVEVAAFILGGAR